MDVEQHKAVALCNDSSKSIRSRIGIMKFAVVLLALAATAAGAQGLSPAMSTMAPIPGEPSTTPKEAAITLHAAAVAKTGSVRFLPVEAGRVDSMRKRNALSTKVMQVGFNRELRDEGETLQSPTLEFVSLSEAQAGKVARLSVDSPGALAMRVGLQVADLPMGVELRFTGSDQTDVVLVKAAEIAAGRSPEGIYWSPVTEGSTQLIEIYVPEGASISADAIKIGSISHMFASPSAKFGQAKIGESDSCNVDAACSVPASTALANSRKAVAKMVFQANCDPFNPTRLASCLCTGTLINDVDLTTQIPYFYSANHCISSQTEASTLTTHWFHEYPTCTAGIASGSVATSTKQVTGGATLIYRDVNRDALLLRLNNPAPAGAYFSGWDPNSMLPTPNTVVPIAVTGIHHPSGDVKKVSRGGMTGFTPISDFANQTFLTVSWTTGTTEGGSSGSGLFTLTNNEYFLRGGLYGGLASCSNSNMAAASGNYDYFSRFDQVYPSIKATIGNTRVLTAVEFYNTELKHYFVSAAQAEVDAITAGFAGATWMRTGLSFPVYSGPDTANAAIVPVCRFYGTPGKGPNSHFYTGYASECTAVKADPGWTYEGLAFAVVLPTDQVCPVGTIPVHRAYNNGHLRNDANHRYSTDINVLNSTPGYTYEGIAMCAPAPVSSPF
jgi:lysyl endopeptidase